MGSQRTVDAKRANLRFLGGRLPDLYVGSAADKGRLELAKAAAEFRSTAKMATQNACIFEKVVAEGEDALVLELVQKYREQEKLVNNDGPQN